MRVTGENSSNDLTGRDGLAGASGRQIEVAGGKDTNGHDEASAGTRRGFAGCKSTGRTIPAEMASIRAATRMEGPRSRNRSFRTVKAEMSPMRFATSVSERPSDAIQDLRSIALAPCATVARPTTELTADRMAEALAVMMLDLVAVLDIGDRRGVLERLANRMDDRGRLPSGSDAALLLGQVGGALMQMGI